MVYPYWGIMFNGAQKMNQCARNWNVQGEYTSHSFETRYLKLSSVCHLMENNLGKFLPFIIIISLIKTKPPIASFKAPRQNLFNQSTFLAQYVPLNHNTATLWCIYNHSRPHSFCYSRFHGWPSTISLFTDAAVFFAHNETI